jgi:c(7)-type cytochrome triheme protein
MIGLFGAAVVLGAVTIQAADKVKPGESVHVYDDPSYAEEHGPVTFSHLQHKESFGEEKLNCKPCHMEKPPLFSMKKDEVASRDVLKMSDMAEGKTCGACHDGKTTINGKTAPSVTDENSCGTCHEKG